MSETPKDGDVVGYVWWCGDYECDCTQAVIVRKIGPTYTGEPGSYGWHEEVLWSGTFISGPVEDHRVSDMELALAAEEMGLVETARGVYRATKGAKEVEG